MQHGYPYAGRIAGPEVLNLYGLQSAAGGVPIGTRRHARLTVLGFHHSSSGSRCRSRHLLSVVLWTSCLAVPLPQGLTAPHFGHIQPARPSWHAEALQPRT